MKLFFSKKYITAAFLILLLTIISITYYLNSRTLVGNWKSNYDSIKIQKTGSLYLLAFENKIFIFCELKNECFFAKHDNKSIKIKKGDPVICKGSHINHLYDYLGNEYWRTE